MGRRRSPSAPLADWSGFGAGAWPAYPSSSRATTGTPSTLPLHVPPQEKRRRAKDHNDQDNPDNTRHAAVLRKLSPGKNIARQKLVSHINPCLGSVVVSSRSRRCSILPRTTSTSPGGNGPWRVP